MAMDYLQLRVEQAEALVRQDGGDPGAKRRLHEAQRQYTRTLEYQRYFQRKWGLGDDNVHRQHALYLKHMGYPWAVRNTIACFVRFGLRSGELTAEERLERIVRSKVRRDVRQACMWDEELSQLEGEPKERRLMELARSELLTRAFHS